MSILVIVISVFMSSVANNMYDNWTTSDVLMPRGDRGLAAASHNNNIYIMGGKENPLQLTQYDISKNEMKDHGQMNLSVGIWIGIWGWGQYYTTQNHIVYSVALETLSTFDLTTKTVVDIMGIPMHVGDTPCVTTTTKLLFILGGNSGPPTYDALNTLQILSLVNYTWLLNQPSMNTTRGGLTCNIHPENNLLYAIGGGTNTVEILNISNIQSWQYINNTLLYPVTNLRSIIWGSSILLIGGYYDINNDTSSRVRIDAISVIDIHTHLISYGGTLNYAIYASAAIIVNDTIYVFGGSRIGAGVRTWQYLVLPPTPMPTYDPTTDPTKNPTHIPTFNPTINPTTDPTYHPTQNPTYLPTETPTYLPSRHTTITPTVFPTISPTLQLDCSNCIVKYEAVCSDGYTDLDQTDYYYGKYCRPCPDGTAGIVGQCSECDTMEEPNHNRTGCEYYQPWWLYLLETVSAIGILGCCTALIIWCWKKGRYSISDIDKNKSASLIENIETTVELQK